VLNAEVSLLKGLSVGSLGFGVEFAEADAALEFSLA
jgi:hypothetical protein